MLITSCYFGTRPTGIHPAPAAHDCVFLSNNPGLKDEAERNGWQFVLVSQLPLSDDVLISSLQSKYVKFLRFLDDFAQLRSSEGVLYFDHKFQVSSDHLAAMLAGSSREIVIRNTPRLKPTIEHEVEPAMRQARYRHAMPATLEWVDRHVATGEYTREVRIVNTGLILYRNPDHAREFTDQVHDTCWRLAQPECQIIWAVLSQKYTGMIGRLDWQSVEPIWKERSALQEAA